MGGGVFFAEIRALRDSRKGPDSLFVLCFRERAELFGPFEVCVRMEAVCGEVGERRRSPLKRKFFGFFQDGRSSEKGRKAGGRRTGLSEKEGGLCFHAVNVSGGGNAGKRLCKKEQRLFEVAGKSGSSPLKGIFGGFVVPASEVRRRRKRRKEALQKRTEAIRGRGQKWVKSFKRHIWRLCCPGFGGQAAAETPERGFAKKNRGYSRSRAKVGQVL